MKRLHWMVPMLALGMMMTPGQSGAQETNDHLRELERRRTELVRQLRALDRQLEELAPERGTSRFRFRTPERAFAYGFSTGRDFPAPQVLSLSTSRAQLGVVVRTRADGENEEQEKGAILEWVTPGGPADEAGLRAGDVITRFNGESLVGPYPEAGPDESPGAIKLIALVRDADPGDDVTIEYVRDGKTDTTTATLRRLNGVSVFVEGVGRNGAAAESLRVRARELAEPGRFEVFGGPGRGAELLTLLMPGLWSDIQLVAVNDQLGAYFGTNEGLLVIRAPEDEDLGLRGGDVILAIDTREPRTPSRALRILRSYEAGESMDLTIMRNRKRQTITVTVPEERMRRRRRFDQRFD